MLHHRLLTVTPLLMLALLSSAGNEPVLVNLQIQGLKKGFSGQIWTRGHNLTAIFAGPTRQCIGAVQGSHHCDGTNNKRYPQPVPTFNAALDDASKKYGFSFTADFCPQYDDFFITSILGEFGSKTHYWAQFLNGNYNQYGGCQIQVKSGDNLLYKLTPITPLKSTVTDEEDGSAVVGADVNGQPEKTDAEGQVSLAVTFKEFGQVGTKAENLGLD